VPICPYDLDQICAGEHSQEHSIPHEAEERLRDIAENFVFEHGSGKTDMETISVGDEVKDRLEQLGYK